eukprot:CAMPEP_0182857556 /NCGR_PEP_ID=MMETSP0034_2-20130328/3119_1 /TAXON_ID=156128 /ORGANISM="Nephroselmis pyriformis, Strain CCMP717" /LENGTH=70 /DNA_ID=CAMNT_0024988801 /DNA_START=85 /DNA_END=294 /DNA_ORIENTATION=+
MNALPRAQTLHPKLPPACPARVHLARPPRASASSLGGHLISPRIVAGMFTGRSVSGMFNDRNEDLVDRLV